MAFFVLAQSIASWQGHLLMNKNQSQKIIHYCQRMDSKGWVSNHDGNLSLKLSQKKSFLVTPTARSKADLKESDLISIDIEGKVLEGKGKPFSEWAYHKSVFLGREDAQAVIHAHPPSAMAVGCANQEMLTWAVPEAVVSLGPGVPLVGLGLPQSQESISEFENLLPYYDAVMVGGNGVFCWGESLEQAFLRLELVEHLASILLKTMVFGGPQLLEKDQVLKLLQKRSDAGLALPADPNRPQWNLVSE